MKGRITHSYNSATQFWKQVSPHLFQNVAENCLLLGIANRYRSTPPTRLHASAVFDGTKLVAALLLSEYHSMRVALLTKTNDEEALASLYRKAKNANVGLTHLNAEWNTAEVMTRILKEDGRKLKDLRSLGLYRCRNIKLPKQGSAVLKPATLRDLDFAAKWTSLFMSEAMPEDPPVKRAQTEATIRSGLVFLEDKGERVAMASVSRDLEVTCSINLVYTPPKFRRKGYGALVTALLTEHALKTGKQETNLFADLKNPTSNKIYAKIGYEMIGRTKHKTLI